MRLCRWIIFYLNTLALCSWAQEPGLTNPGSPALTRPFLSRIRGLFDIELPQLDPPGTVKFILYPHISDLVRRDYVRTDVGFRWTLNDQVEFSTEGAAFFTHGFGEQATGNGIGELRYGLKYLIHESLPPDFEASANLSVTQPLTHRPIDLSDGYQHITPSVIIQRHSPNNRHLTVFTELSLDAISPSGKAGAMQINQPRDDSYSVTLGGVYDLGQIKWTLAGTYTTTALISSRAEHFFYLRPSVLWYVPKKFVFNTKTQWLIGLGTPMSWGPDGYNIKLNSRVRAEITFRQVIATVRRHTFK